MFRLLMASVGSSARKELDKKKEKVGDTTVVRTCNGPDDGSFGRTKGKKNKMRKRERVGRTDGANIKRRE